jgi:tetratricopeptide (TPR) repeat protein
MGVTELLSEAAEAWGTNWDTVIALLRRAVEIDPWRADLRDKLGLALAAAGDSAAATRQLHLALDLDPDHPKYWADLAMVAFGESDYRTACSLLEEAIARRPDYVSATVELTRCYSRLDQQIAMAEAGSRAINIDPLGDAKLQVTAILKAHWRPGASRSAAVGDFFSARDLPPGEAIPALERVLTILEGGSANHSIVLETLAGKYFLLDQHDRCAEYSLRALTGLPCARALAAKPRQGGMIEAGRDHDAKTVYATLIQNLFNEEALLTALKVDTGRIQDLREAIVHTATGIYEIRRGGNVFVISTPNGSQVLHEVFDRSDLALAEW